MEKINEGSSVKESEELEELPLSPDNKGKEEALLLRDPNELPPKWALWSAASYAFIMLFIGLPLWWKTTTVERVPLPYHEMLTLHEQFQDEKFLLPFYVALKGFSGASIPLTQDRSWSFNEVSISDLESGILKTSHSLEEIDRRLCILQKSATGSTKTDNDSNGKGHLTVFSVTDPRIYNEFGDDLVIGNCRNLYSISNSSNLQVEKLNSVFDELTTSANTDEDLPFAVSYNILFTLIIPEPELFDVTWNIEKAVNGYVTPMLSNLPELASFVTRSQVLYYHKLNLRPSLVNETYEVAYEQLPLVINPVETKLSSFVSANPVFNFLVYISPCDVSPLQILDEDGNQLETNAFYVPQWGGIQIYNSMCSKDRTHNVHELDMTHVMSIFISQFRDLLGIPELERTNVVDFYGSALRDWEIDLIVRRRLVKLLETSSNTLKSLGNLLEQITNIVVKEEVGNEVQLSVHSLQLAHEVALAGRITQASRHARTAYTASENAFHHPSNLAQLYFPDDQKYAIYIPLYLPVGIPVLLSLRAIVKYILSWRTRKEKAD